MKTNQTHSIAETKSVEATTLLRKVSVATGAALLASLAASHASTDYGPAIWRPACSSNLYTTGYGHKFLVVHDMEGYYYWAVTVMFPSCGSPNNPSQVSPTYSVNGKHDTSSDSPAGEVTQSVREAYYGFQARCWNQHSTGVEHEGFQSNPAWYTDAMYNSSSALYRHMCDVYGIPKDRNHIVGHGEKSNAAWASWAGPNLGINAYCNTHTDPGPYWDWSRFMTMIIGNVTVDNSNAGFSASANWATGTSSTDKYGADYRFRGTQAISDPATWTGNLYAGQHSVYAWWAQGGNRLSSAAYVVYHGGTSTTVSVNQQANGGKWNLLGTWGDFASGNNNVLLSCWGTTGYVVIADAIKWQ